MDTNFNFGKMFKSFESLEFPKEAKTDKTLKELYEEMIFKEDNSNVCLGRNLVKYKQTYEEYLKEIEKNSNIASNLQKLAQYEEDSS